MLRNKKLLLLFLLIFFINLFVSGYTDQQVRENEEKVIGFSTPPFHTWTATVQIFSTDPENTGWWGLRKLPAEKKLNFEGKYIGVIFGGFLSEKRNGEFRVTWIRPDGELFKENVWSGTVSSGLCSFMSDLSIEDCNQRDERKEIDRSSFRGVITDKKEKGCVVGFPGDWRLEISINNKIQKIFYLEV